MIMSGVWQPDKCSAIGWFPLSDLLDHLIACPASGVHAYRDGLTFSSQPQLTADGGVGDQKLCV
jgi:hypothetical protein